MSGAWEKAKPAARSSSKRTPTLATPLLGIERAQVVLAPGQHRIRFHDGKRARNALPDDAGSQHLVSPHQFAPGAAERLTVERPLQRTVGLGVVDAGFRRITGRERAFHAACS